MPATSGMTGAGTAGDTTVAGSAALAGSGGAQSMGGTSDAGTAGTDAAGTTGGGMAGAGGTSGNKRPNIMVVLLDDMGFSDLGAYGSEIRTPNIDGLAEQGTRFRNFHVTPRCSPTRISLLTGLYTQQAATMPGDSLPPLRTDNNVTLPEMLGAAGYRTYMAGKWHIGQQPGQVPRARGFDHAFGFGPDASGAEANKWDKTAYGFQSKNNAIQPHKYGNGPKDFYQAAAFGDYAIDYLNYHYDQHDDAPFFMYLAFNAPHFPVQADSAMLDVAPAGGMSYLDMYGKGWDQLRTDRYARMLKNGVIDNSFGLSPAEPFKGCMQKPDCASLPDMVIPAWSSLGTDQKADLTRKMALYAASIESVDKALGRVIGQLKAQGEFDNTLIFVLSDNGGNWEGGITGTAFGKTAPLTGTQLTNMGQPGQDDHIQVGGGWAHVENTPFRFYKHYTHMGGVKSPLIVSWPGHTAKAGGWTDQYAHVVDIVPTILQATGAQHPDMFGGHAVLPLEGMQLVDTISKGAAPMVRQLGWEHESNRAWIEGDFKLVVRHEDGDQLELYNVKTDPSEMHDLAASNPAKVKRLVDEWNQWATHVGVPADRILKVP